MESFKNLNLQNRREVQRKDPLEAHELHPITDVLPPYQMTDVDCGQPSLPTLQKRFSLWNQSSSSSGFRLFFFLFSNLHISWIVSNCIRNSESAASLGTQHARCSRFAIPWPPARRNRVSSLEPRAHRRWVVPYIGAVESRACFRRPCCRSRPGITSISFEQGERKACAARVLSCHGRWPSATASEAGEDRGGLICKFYFIFFCKI